MINEVLPIDGWKACGIDFNSKGCIIKYKHVDMSYLRCPCCGDHDLTIHRRYTVRVRDVSTIVFRLPTEEEWEQAAGHMPKDAEFNCGANDILRPVTAYSGTLAACGAVDMRGNCREWTADRSGSSRKVKGGFRDSGRMDCRMENRDNLRKANSGYPNVGFRIVREDKPAAKQL